jgi:hypothetical protein
MPGLLEALFDAGRRPKAPSERLSLASPPSPEVPAQTEQEKQETIFQEEVLNSPQTHLARESQTVERRFGQSHAKLFISIGRKVRTPDGSGTLIQVFAERVTVLLDSEREKCSFYHPAEIEPVSTE